MQSPATTSRTDADDHALMKLRRCCCVSIVVLISLAIILVHFVVLNNMIISKFRDPEVSLNNIKLQRFSVNPSLSTLLSISFSANVRVRNPNRYDFRYRNSTMLLTYHSRRVGVVELGAGIIPSRRKTVELPVVITLEAVRVVVNALWDVISTGVARFSLDAVVSGWVELQPRHCEKHWHATAISDCDIEVFIANMTVKQLQCKHKINL